MGGGEGQDFMVLAFLCLIFVFGGCESARQAADRASTRNDYCSFFRVFAYVHSKK